MPKNKKNRNIPVQPVFRIFCEGEKTEPLYIKGYISHFHSEKRRIILVGDTNKNTPVQLVDIAITAKKQGSVSDIIWVVFDRESVAKYSHELHAQARNNAKKNGVEIALSNVCFELWLLLHFRFSSSPYASCNDLLKNSKLKEDLRLLGIEDYDKGLPLIFDTVKDLVPAAIINAARIKKEAEETAEKGKSEPHYLNPYVDVHEMFQDMQNFATGKPSIRA